MGTRSPTSSAPTRWRVPATAFSQQPWKALYFGYWLVSLPLVVSWWIAQWTFRLHPHATLFTLYESLYARFIHRGMQLVAQTAFFTDVLKFGDAPGELTPEALNQRGKFSRTRAEWISTPVDADKWFKGHAVKEGCEPAWIAGVVWGKPGRGPPREDLVVGPNETVFLHLHGGGLTMGNATEHYFINRFADQISQCEAIDHVFSPDYRQLDQGPWPLPLVDCITAYAYLVDTLRVAPSRILVGGDSAGGLLALALLRYLRDDVKVELPRAALLVSPLANVSRWLGPKMQLQPSPNRYIDLLNIEAMAPFIASLLLRDNPVSLLDSPYLSPAADSVPATPELFARFPPCLVTGGKMEHYIEDVRELVKRLKLGAVECEYLEGKGAPHDWLILDWVSDKRKAGAVEQMQAWVDKQFA